MDEKIMEMFLKENQSPYYIHNELNCSIKQVYHCIKQHEESVRASQKKEITYGD